MKKAFLIAAVVVIIGGYVYYEHTHGTSSADQLATNDAQDSVTATPEATSTPTDGSTVTPTPQPTPTPTAALSGYKDGTYTGPVADAFYGNLQVQAIIQGGRLSDVKFLQYPNDQEHSIEVNSMSNPRLRSEAIAAQSANVDIVSGATQSSEAFQQSLGAALAQAKS